MAWNKALASFFCCLSLHGADTRYVLTQYGKTAYVSMDNGSKTVVFQAGLGDDKSAWRKLLEKSNNSFSFVATDRLGKGESSDATTGRSPCDIAKEQREALKNAGFKPPYILVGHSLGGLYQYVFAKMYPSDVAAMVLLDPTHPKHWESLQKESSFLAVLVKTLRFTLFSKEDTKEFDAQTDCLSELDVKTQLPIPVTFLFSGNFSVIEKGAFEDMIIGLRGDWLRLVESANSKTIRDSGHYLQDMATNETLNAISEALYNGDK